MLTGRSQTPEGRIAVMDDFATSNWVAKHAQAVWRLLLTLWTRGSFFPFCTSRTNRGSYDANAASRTANNDRRAELPPACHMRPCPTRKEAALGKLCRGGRTRTCQIREPDEDAAGDSSRERASLLIWLTSAWLPTRPTIWTRQASNLPEPSTAASVRSRRPRGDA